MEKKLSEKSSKTWGCEHGCDVRYKPCKHIERKLPQVSDKRTIHVDDIANFSMDVFTFYHPKFELEEFKEEMKTYGFVENWDLELLIAKFFYGMSNRSITRDQDFVSARTTDRRINQLVRLLRERGYGKKQEKAK